MNESYLYTPTNQTSDDNHGHHDYMRHLPAWYQPLYVSLCAVVAIISFFGNVTIFHVVRTVKKLQTPTNYFLLSLITADLLTSAVLVPFYIEIYVHNTGNRYLCLIRKYLFLATSSGSLLSLSLVSTDRMLAISYPYWYEQKVTKKVALTIITFLWLWIVLFNGFTFYQFSEWDYILPTCSTGLPKLLYLVVTPPSFYLPGVIIIGVYIKIYFVARKHQRIITSEKMRAKSLSEPNFLQIQIDPCNVLNSCNTSINSCNTCIADITIHTPRLDRISNTDLSIHSSRSRTDTLSSYSSTSTLPSPRPNRSRTITILSTTINEGKKRIKKVKENIASDLKAAKTIGILVGVFLLCWSPIASYYIYINVCNVELKFENEYGYLHDVFMFLSFINATVDPYLYTIRNKTIKKYVYRFYVRMLNHFRKI